jgi:hypothetical protein
MYKQTRLERITEAIRVYGSANFDWGVAALSANKDTTHLDSCRKYVEHLMSNINHDLKELVNDIEDYAIEYHDDLIQQASKRKSISFNEYSNKSNNLVEGI